MPTSRPSAPATLNTSNALAANAQGFWLVDANVDNPDLSSHGQPVLTRYGSPSYSTSGVLGGHFVGGASQVETSHTLNPQISVLPYSFGCIFATAGAKSASSGLDFLAMLGDQTNTSGAIFAYLVVDDGTFSAAGHLVLAFRNQAFGGSVTHDLGAVDDGLIHAVNVNMALHPPSSTTIDVDISLDGSTTNFQDANGQFIGDTYGYFSLLGYSNVSGNALLSATSNALAAAGWYATTNVSNADANAATADPWTVLQGVAAPARVPFTPWPQLGPMLAQ